MQGAARRRSEVPRSRQRPALAAMSDAPPQEGKTPQPVLLLSESDLCAPSRDSPYAELSLASCVARRDSAAAIALSRSAAAC
jgi:hypothetical protein